MTKEHKIIELRISREADNEEFLKEFLIDNPDATIVYEDFIDKDQWEIVTESNY